jgi:hypothetical protein
LLILFAFFDDTASIGGLLFRKMEMTPVSSVVMRREGQLLRLASLGFDSTRLDSPSATTIMASSPLVAGVLENAVLTGTRWFVTFVSTLTKLAPERVACRG